MAIGRTNAGGGGFNKSVIIVTAPTGSTVTCTKGTVVKTATEKNGEWWFKNLDIGTWMLKATLSGQTATQTVNVTQFGVYRVTMAYRFTPEFTYTGDYEVVEDDDTPITDFANWKGNWKIRFLTSGDFTAINMYGWDGRLDVFLVGGGGAGNAGNAFLSGGGGGRTATYKGITVSVNVAYPIVVGAGGSASAASGGNTSAFLKTANGGGGASGGGGDGGSGGGQWDAAGGSDGSNGGGGNGGTGQGTTTREFGESGNTLYSGGGGGFGSPGGDGGGGSANTSEVNGVDNLGGGGAGYTTDNTHFGRGGSGIVIIRNAR